MIAGGVFVGVCGPSGAGKDALIDAARARLAGRPEFVFVRRIITRMSDASSEDHDTVDEQAFATLAAHGGFALSWRAHGLGYGLPASVDAAIAGGGVAVANISRAVIPDLRRRYRGVRIVLVTASPDILATRLARRGREDRASILARLGRQAQFTAEPGMVDVIDNSGRLEDAAARFAAILDEARASALAAIRLQSLSK